MKTTKKIAYLSIFVALAMILSFVESQIPTFIPVSGIKLGLPNIAIIFLLYRFGWKEATIVNLVRILLVSWLFGSAYSLLYSLTGGILSLLVMIILKKLNWFSCITVSVIGGVFHNIGQIITACIVTSTKEIIGYLPALLISGTIAGIVIGLIGAQLIKRFQNSDNDNDECSE